MIEVKDIMTKNVVCINKNVPVVDAIRLMSKKNITGVPVVEDDMTLLGDYFGTGRAQIIPHL